jgi:hypothetical protein
MQGYGVRFCVLHLDFELAGVGANFPVVLSLPLGFRRNTEQMD